MQGNANREDMPPPMDRQRALLHWLRDQLGLDNFRLEPASADASFRRYFRLIPARGKSLIVMDAPPEKEDCEPFVRITGLLWDVGLNVPELLEVNLDQGFLLLGDLGSQPYLGALTEETVSQLYGDALDALSQMQHRAPSDKRLPPYGRELLLAEMELFREWLVGRHLGLRLANAEHSLLDRSFDLLAERALAQPAVFVHRDYHSRNLMVTGRNNPGILDYQDAVVGGVTYDLVSLLRDCYVRWPRDRVERWVEEYRRRLVTLGLVDATVAPGEFLGWFDWMGVQRHLKASGIFARLRHRDGKAGYLADIPRTLGYIREVAPGYPELAGLGAFIEEQLQPLLESGDG
jgi:aminoglycoside/choline kinase family phosphotransferase